MSLYFYEMVALCGISENDLSYVTTGLDTNAFPSDDQLIVLNKSEAISDINFLFNLLNYSYAGYSYFGGDAAFENAKENIIESINSYPKEKIDSEELANILV